jgi:hypothetical protein
VAQVVGLVPGLAPEPVQTSQVIEVGTRICAALAAAGRTPLTPAAHHLAKEVFEDIGEAAGTTAHAATAAHAALFEGCMAVAVIGCPLLRVLEHFVG